MRVRAGYGYWIVCDDRGLRNMSGPVSCHLPSHPGREERLHKEREVPVTASHSQQLSPAAGRQRYGRLAASPSTSPPSNVRQVLRPDI